MAKNKKGTTLKKVSEIAGVTQSTASRILNGTSDYSYSKETIKKVFNVAQKEGYRTNQLYRSVFTGITKSVGVISSDSEFYSLINTGIHDRLLEADYAILLDVNQNDFTCFVPNLLFV